MEYLFYILYTGYMGSAKKSSDIIKANVKFSIFSIFTFYILLLATISIVSAGRHFFPELSGKPLRAILFTVVFGTILISFTILNHYYSADKIRNLNEKYANKINSKKAVIIYWVLLLSIPIITISLALSVTK